MINKIINWCNDNSGFVPILVIILGGIGYCINYVLKNIFKKSELDLVKPTFYSFGEKYNIIAVHQFEKSNDISGYKQLGQNSRPDQWKKLIKINSFLNFRFKIEPINDNDILTVIISRNGKERHKAINFNKQLF